MTGNSLGKVTVVILVVGYDADCTPGFCMMCLERKIFRHFGAIETREAGEKLSKDFQDWKRHIGPNPLIVELDKGAAAQFFQDKLGYRSDIPKSNFDLRTFHWVIEGKALEAKCDYNEEGVALDVLALRQAALFTQLCNKSRKLQGLQIAADHHHSKHKEASRRSHQ